MGLNTIAQNILLHRIAEAQVGLSCILKQSTKQDIENKTYKLDDFLILQSKIVMGTQNNIVNVYKTLVRI